jgi:solute carrier family 12 (sodium/potassium/chloride transporter), member 2
MKEVGEEQSEGDVIYDRDQQDESSKDLQEQVQEQELQKYGVIPGVFVPTLVTILGVILFLRVGWVVGNGGLFGSFLIITLSFLITACTGLSMSCFVTNTRVGAGGAFSMISQSLGLEVGGSIGIPLYVSQALAVTMYIFGFREGWLWIFPSHPALFVDLGALAVIVGITWISTSFAFRIQYGILAIVIAAIGSIFLGGLTHPVQQSVEWWGNFPGVMEDGFTGITFWAVFAIFFPASTGIMAGANMSGELKDPRKSIPLGTLSAIGLTYFIYMGLAYWSARYSTPEELLENYTVMIDKAFWSPLVIAGLLGATFSSALASFVGAPRILQALGAHSIFPKGKWLAARSKKGEPINAIIITTGLVFAGLLLRNLNMVAPLITMTFLITYSMINLIVLLEMNLKLISFRPSFKIPKLVALTGFLGCVFAIFVINAIFGFVAVILVCIIFVLLLKKQLKAPFSDVRSGIFNAFAEWAAKRIKLMHGRTERAWKPNILLPVEDIGRLHGVFRIVFQIAQPIGSVKILGVVNRSDLQSFEKQIADVSTAYLKRGVFSSFSVIEEESFSKGIIQGLQALRGSFFRPNVLCVELPKNKKLHQNLWHVVEASQYSNVGVILIVDHLEAGLGCQERINLWIPEQEEWSVEMNFDNLDLLLLIGYSLHQSWQGEIRFFVQVSSSGQKKKAEEFLTRLIYLARLPVSERRVIVASTLKQAVKEAPRADINLFPLEDHKVQVLWDLRDATHTTCLFCRDSGTESALA